MCGLEEGYDDTSWSSGTLGLSSQDPVQTAGPHSEEVLLGKEEPFSGVMSVPSLSLLPLLSLLIHSLLFARPLRGFQDSLTLELGFL